VGVLSEGDNAGVPDNSVKKLEVAMRYGEMGPVEGSDVSVQPRPDFRRNVADR